VRITFALRSERGRYDFKKNKAFFPHVLLRSSKLRDVWFRCWKEGRSTKQYNIHLVKYSPRRVFPRLKSEGFFPSLYHLLPYCPYESSRRYNELFLLDFPESLQRLLRKKLYSCKISCKGQLHSNKNPHQLLVTVHIQCLILEI